jgi:uncharacterized cofD-like protein
MRAVALGGGHGLVASLLAAHEVADEVTAIVGVADNGGSSGRLREFWQGCPALGDARLTISNLLGPESKLAQLLEYRFETGELAGHALGNLILFGLLEKTGALDLALDELAALGGLTTRVLPASNAPLVLQGMTITGEPLIGQLAVHWSPAVERVWVLPDVDPLPAVIEAIASADVVLLGPGSLYTSVLATALAPGIAKAINETQALVVFVANLAPQEAETRGYDLEHTIGALTAHGVVPDVVLVHAEDSPGPAVSMGESIRLVGSKLSENGVVHTPHLLAGALGRVVGGGKTLQP